MNAPTRRGRFDRREFLGRTATLAAASLFCVQRGAAAEPPPETARIRLNKVRSICLAPQYVAEELLRAEGFTDVQYFGDGPAGIGGVPSAKALGAGLLDISMNFAAPLVIALDEGSPITMLAGVHPGCFELFATQRIRTITDLKGKTAAVLNLNSAQHVFLASIATSVGIDPQRDITWALHPPEEAKQLLAEGKIDAFLGFPPDPQELRTKNIGHVVLNSTTDRPWSQYFCCMVAANRDFAKKYPIATRRALRAIIKGGNICAADPQRGAKAFLDQGFRTSPEYAGQAIREIPYGRWRDYNPEETVRFYALRLREAGMVRSAPRQLIAQGADWRFFNELKRELKV